MKRAVVSLLAIGVVLGSGIGRGAGAQQQKIEHYQLKESETMLSDVHNALKENYYDPTFHGLDVDARYKAYKDRVKKSETLAESFRTVAAYLAGLGDSHTFFLPPRRSYTFDYGYRMQMVGEDCYITDLRPESDAAQKLHPGDQVLSLDGYGVGRKDIWQLDYYLRQIAPKSTTEFTLRAPSGEVRKVQVLTKYVQGKRFKDLTWHADFVQLTLEREKAQHLLRQRFVEQGDVMFWKMPAFNLEDKDVDLMIRIARNHKTLILDLRGNPGGYITTLARMIGSFFDHDVRIATQITRKGEKPQIAKSRGKDIFTGNLIVLVDSGSASSSELFARVIQLEHRGTVVGDRSSGSVMEARIYRFDAGVGSLVIYGASITEADLMMADGKTLEKVGVTPDVRVLPSALQLAEGQDPALARAAEFGGIKLDPKAAGKLFPFEWAPM